MKEKETKKLELNTKILENFEKIMATKLDEVEELKVTELDKGSKLVNIISLCANVRTLILEGDQRLNCDKILTNIFKPEKLENLVLNNIKLPTAEVLKRFTNLRKISLSQIRFCSVQDFFNGVVNPKKIESIHIIDVDMTNLSIQILKKFSNLRELNLNHVKNLRLDDLTFLQKNQKILKMSIVNNQIPITQINILLKIPCLKHITLDIINEKGNIIENGKIQIQDENKVIINIPGKHLELFTKRVQWQDMDVINLIFCQVMKDGYSCCVKLLKNFKKECNIIVKDFACLNREKAREIKNILKLETIEFENGKRMDIIDFIEIRTEIERILQKVKKDQTEPEKFLQIYKLLGQEFEIVEKGNLDIKNKTCTPLQICEFLQNCLKCIQIPCNQITGEDLEEEKKHFWNQVKIEEKWYNVDLSLDVENIKKNKTEYCLLGDQTFFETHRPKSGKNHYCEENFNPKLVSVFFKTGLFKESLVASYLEMIAEKIKKLFVFNQKQDFLALPEARKDRN